MNEKMKYWLSQIELGEWFLNAQYYYRPRNDKERKLMLNCYEEGYNKGYEAGKPKWHDLRKDLNDLPEENGQYLVAYRNYQNLEEIVTETLEWNDLRFVDENYEDIPWFDCKDVLVAWCEVPKFKEE